MNERLGESCGEVKKKVNIVWSFGDNAENIARHAMVELGRGMDGKLRELWMFGWSWIDGWNNRRGHGGWTFSSFACGRIFWI